MSLLQLAYSALGDTFSAFLYGLFSTVITCCVMLIAWRMVAHG